jgi:hypothetical protein
VSTAPHDWLRPDRLADRWREAPLVEAAPAPAAAPEPGPIAWCARLRELAVARQGEEAAIVRLVDELARLCALRFPEPPSPTAAELAALDPRIEELVAHIEDLDEAAALARRRP